MVSLNAKKRNMKYSTYYMQTCAFNALTSATFSPRKYAFSGESKNGWGF